MTSTYTSKYGKIIKQCPGTPEYWYKGKMVAKGSAVSSADPRVKPTEKDWKFCVGLR